MWGEACIINKSFPCKARWHRRSVSNPSPILLQSFSDPSPTLLQSFSNPSPIPPNPPQVLLHPCKTQKRPNTEAQGVENFRYQSTNVFKIFLSDKEGRKEGKEEGKKEGREGGRKEGRTEGRKEGRKDGRTEGRKEGRRGRSGSRTELKLIN